MTIEESEGFSAKKNIEVTVGITKFTSESVDTTIPYLLKTVWSSGQNISFNIKGVLRFEGQQDGTVKSRATGYPNVTGLKDPLGELERMEVNVFSSSWEDALAGDYTSTITFTSKVVAAA